MHGGPANAAKQEFDLHPTRRRPNNVYSPASFVKSYFDQMGIVPPAEKFKVPDEILGIAMESYTGGRSEARIRHVELPVAPVDFTSEYPTVCVLMELMKVLTARELDFEDATSDVQRLLETITLEKCFDRSLWPRHPVLRAREAPWRRSASPHHVQRVYPERRKQLSHR